ncbi:hypothetical protein [Psychrobacillus sp. L4]|uniref:hypothetical protein n=1 Tax=Psychrobacillus sp. L4 TaxID=3236892 RepID=UPI0036F3D479
MCGIHTNCGSYVERKYAIVVAFNKQMINWSMDAVYYAIDYKGKKLLAKMNCLT